MKLRRLPLFRVLTIYVFACSAMLPAFDTPRAIAVHFPISYPAISFLNARTGWILAARGTAVTVMRTSDAGRSWVRLARLSLAFNEPSMQFVDDRHGWISTVGPTFCGGLKRPPCHTVLLRTGDGGKHWSRLVAPATNGYAITFVDSLHGWLLHSQIPCKSICSRSLYATVDGGMTWRLLPAAPRLSLMTMSWANREHGWLGGGDARSCISSIFATINGGRTWTRQLALPKHCR
ncbi:MAG TPA: hypothetical protein DEV93_02815 [Chloroflexi bacterium]|jgi:photosystem II stability/assembly factor-like uncharacterized protein|nr:hypothetical protein [Chloroflexota bacterium]